VRLDGLNVIAVAAFDGNIWAGQTKIVIGMFVDERADQNQREALQMVFSGEAGGFMANFASVFGEVRGLEYAPISFAVAETSRLGVLRFWEK
jgi:hypothetical protein